MKGLPVMLNVAGRRAVVLGAGSAARRRAASLVECGAQVVVIAPEGMDLEGVECHRRAYRAGDLKGAFLAVIATDDSATNDAGSREARSVGALVNRADEGDAGDLAVMAHGSKGAVTVGVSTGGVSARAAATIRDELLENVREHWLTLLEVAEEYRQLLRGAEDSTTRQAALRRLVDGTALAALKSGGEAGLRAYCERVVAEVKQS